ncbi:MAG: hypothetical protein ACXWC2_07355 [Ramlibacter sp.]
MSKPAIAAVVLLFGLVAGAAADEAQDVAAERARIAAERNRVEADFLSERKACYARFSVSGCIDAAAARRRDLLADLRRQEIALNDAQRKARSAERQKELERKEADAERKQAEAQARGQAERESRQRRADDKAAKAAKSKEAAAAPKAHAARPAASRATRAEPDTEENRRRYEQRIHDAEEHKATVQQHAAEQKKASKPLPVPP